MQKHARDPGLVIQAYLASLRTERGLSENTVEAYRRDLWQLPRTIRINRRKRDRERQPDGECAPAAIDLQRGEAQRHHQRDRAREQNRPDQIVLCKHGSLFPIWERNRAIFQTAALRVRE